MRNFIFLFIVVFISSSCKKETTSTSTTPVRSIDISNAVVTNKGKLVFTDNASATGNAKIYRQYDGRYVLGLEDLDYKSAFDLKVYLSNTPAYSAASLKLFSFMITDANTYYPIPEGVAAETYKYVIIQKDAAMPVASAVMN